MLASLLRYVYLMCMITTGELQSREGCPLPLPLPLAQLL
jgi:hypothetical protein